MSHATTAEALETVVETITVTQGSVIDRLLTVIQWAKDPDTGKIERRRANLTGATIWFAVVQIAPAESELFIKKSTVPTEIEILPQSGDTLGQAKVHILAADTEGVDPTAGEVTKYVYEIHVQLASGNREPVIDESPFVVKRRRMSAYT